MGIDKVIQVTITRETRPVGEVGFGTVLIVGPNPTFVERILFYTENQLATLAAALTGGIASLEYIMASTIFMQNPHINRVAIGRKAVGDTTYADALIAIKLVSNDFYGVVGATRTTAEQEVIATWCQANGKVAVFASADANIIGQTLSADTTSIAHHIKSNNLDRCAAVYHSAATTEAADAALLGYLLAQIPGTTDAAHKVLVGCTSDTLNETQLTNAHDKYCSTYEEIGNLDMVLFGWVGTGEFLDIPIFADWLVARIAEACLRVLAMSKKTPFTDAGITGLESATRKVLEIGLTNNGISPQEINKDTGLQIGGYYTTFPKASTVPVNTKALRSLPDCKFKAFLAGAINTSAIEGTLAL